MVWLDEELTRRQVIRAGAAGGVALSAGGALAGCFGGDDDDNGAPAPQANPSDFKRGGTLRVGATGGGAEDTVDGHKPTSDPDIMRTW
jgi:peptide/nickel transport system substrate-binding protein